MEKKKVISVADKKELSDKIRNTFIIPETSDFVVQQYSQEWDDFIDVDDFDSLPEKCKLNVTVCTSVVISGTTGVDE